jgi:hypothetical protein
MQQVYEIGLLVRLWLPKFIAAFATCIISLGGMNFALLLFPRTAFLDDRGLPMSTMNASHKVRPLSLSKWLCYFHYS